MGNCKIEMLFLWRKVLQFILMSNVAFFDKGNIPIYHSLFNTIHSPRFSIFPSMEDHCINEGPIEKTVLTTERWPAHGNHRVR